MRPTLDFLLFDWLDVTSLAQRPRFSDHSRETFSSVLDTCERIAREKYAPFNRLVDTEEPRFDGEKVILPQATHDAWKAYAESGMLAAAQTLAPAGHWALTADLRTSLLRAAQGERLVCTAWVLKSGRSLSFTEAEVHVERAGPGGVERTLVMKASATMALASHVRAVAPPASPGD